MILALDFDGTVVDHCYPDIGKDVPDAVKYLLEFTKMGGKIILWTMRSNIYLEQSIQWFKDRNISLWAVNENPNQYIWTDSPKVHAKIYIDDAAMGCPLKENPRMGGRPYVDWEIVGPKLMMEQALRP
jgi:hypothetical protein